jgi:maltose alpha-D-glucosyltransferase/alpha-amylase
MEYVPASDEGSAIGIVQQLVPNQGDGWSWTTEELERYYENVAGKPLPQTGQAARDYVGAYTEAACVLGRCTAELHLVLAAATKDPAFAPEEFTVQEIESMSARMRSEAARALDLLKAGLSRLPDDFLETAGIALGKRKQILDKLVLPPDGRFGKRIRTHGDYHLGQVLRTRNEFVILDFEGEPGRSLVERRAKYSPLRDVAGMLRSFSYAANATLDAYIKRHPDDFASLEPWARVWEKTVAAEFLSSYRKTIAPGNILPPDDAEFDRLLDALLLEKAMYELTYELNNRPGWVRIPLAGILTLVE